MVEEFCLYCFDTSNLTKMHLFPQVIGGRICVYFCCRRCNSIIGSEIEGKIKRCLFFAFGIDRLGLQDTDEALSQLKITNADTGERLKLVNGKLFGTAKMRSPTKRIAPPKDMRRLIRRDVGKRFPGHLEEYMRKFASGNARIKVEDEEHFFWVEQKKVKVVYEGRERFPYGLLAKIAHEGTFLW